MPGKHHLRGFKIAKKIGSPLRGSWTMLPLGKKLDLPLACEVKMYFFLSCYCRAEKYWFPQQNTDFWVWEYWKAQIQLVGWIQQKCLCYTKYWKMSHYVCFFCRWWCDLHLDDPATSRPACQGRAPLPPRRLLPLRDPAPLQGVHRLHRGPRHRLALQESRWYQGRSRSCGQAKRYSKLFTSVGYLEIGNLWSLSCSWSRRCWSWSWSWSRSFWSRNFLLRSARDQHCYYVKYHTKKLLKFVLTVGKNVTPWKGYTPGIHMDCVLVFLYPFLIFALAPVFTLPH